MLTTYRIDRNVFATFTNLTFLAAALFRVYASYIQKETSALYIGQFGFSAMIYVLIGSSSFSFHKTSTLYVAAHYFDILFGILLAAHVFYVVVAVCIHWVVMFRMPHFESVCVLLMSIAYISSVFFIIVEYDLVYSNQYWLYVGFSSLTSLLYIPLRIKLMYSMTHSWTVAITESSILLATFAAAICAQSQLLGVRYYANDQNHEYYDFYHGQWHFLLAVSTSIVYTRVAQVSDALASIRSNVKTQSKFSNEHPWIDRLGLALLFIYSMMVIGLKETRTDIVVSKIWLGIVCFFLCVHSIATIYLAHGIVCKNRCIAWCKKPTLKCENIWPTYLPDA
jgi:hypothetical protein